MKVQQDNYNKPISYQIIDHNERQSRIKFEWNRFIRFSITSESSRGSFFEAICFWLRFADGEE
jgi:hypothetical protein